MKRKIVVIFCLFVTQSCFSQFKTNTELGIQTGVMYYLGDLNKCDGCFSGGHFQESKPFISLNYKQNIDKRISYRANILLGQISGDDRLENRDSLSNARGLHFKSNIYELSGNVEFNFLPYELGNPRYKWTPYLFLDFQCFILILRLKMQMENGLIYNLFQLKARELPHFLTGRNIGLLSSQFH